MNLPTPSIGINRTNGLVENLDTDFAGLRQYNFHIFEEGLKSLQTVGNKIKLPILNQIKRAHQK